MAIILTNIRLARDVKEGLEMGGRHKVRDVDLASRAEYASAEVLLLERPGVWLSGEKIASMPRLRLIQTIFAGVDDIDFRMVPENIIVCGNVGAYARTMAEHVFGVVLYLGRGFAVDQENLRKGVFLRNVNGLLLDGKTMGVLGAGGISRSVARLARAFGMRTIGMNTDGRPVPNFDLVVSGRGMNKILRESDVLVISLPLTRRTENLIDASKLCLMKDDAILVNVGRGKVVDEKALYERLKVQPRFKAAIDVWWVYPKSGERFAQHHPFFDLPNFMGTPHVSGNALGGVSIAQSYAARNVRRFIDGQPLKGEVDRGDYERTPSVSPPVK